MRILLTLMAIALANLANADEPSSDPSDYPPPDSYLPASVRAEIEDKTFFSGAHLGRITSTKNAEALLLGTWKCDQGNTNTFTASGLWIMTDHTGTGSEKWDVQDGQLIEIREPAADRPYRILFLTEHECLLRVEHHGGGYIFWWR